MFPLIVAHIAVIAVCICIAAFLLTRKSAKETVYFIALCFYISAYAFGNLQLLSADTVPTVVNALQVENIGIPAIAPFFLLSIIQLCAPRLLRKWMGIAAVIFAAFFTLVVFFNGYHHLYYTSYQVRFGAYAQVFLGKGPLYFINQAVVVACFVLIIVILIRRLFTWSKSVRRQMSLIIVGCAVTLLGNIINVTGFPPLDIDVVVYTCGVTAVLFFICILSNRLYDLVPMASELAIETMDDAMIVLNEDASYLFSNNAALQLFPDLQTIIPSTPVATVTGWPEALMGRLSPGPVSVTVEVDGETHHFRAMVSSVKKNNGDLLGWSIVMRDTTETVELMEQLQKLAITDSLTGLYNRRHFVELVQHEQKSSAFKPKKLAMIMFDIDHFKDINDNYGHAAGDAVLIAVSDAVQAVLRASDILSRYGGEEFTILSTNTDINGARIFAERLRRVIENLKVEYEGHVLQVKASFGISEFEPGDSIDDAIEAADQAMYTAKATGRNRVVVSEGLPAPAGHHNPYAAMLEETTKV